jgi:hypothetical protein
MQDEPTIVRSLLTLLPQSPISGAVARGFQSRASIPRCPLRPQQPTDLGGALSEAIDRTRKWRSSSEVAVPASNSPTFRRRIVKFVEGLHDSARMAIGLFWCTPKARVTSGGGCSGLVRKINALSQCAVKPTFASQRHSSSLSNRLRTKEMKHSISPTKQDLTTLADTYPANEAAWPTS